MKSLRCLLFLMLTVYATDGFEWPPISTAKCTQTTKLKAMYGSMVFQPSLKDEPMTSFQVDVEWNDLQFHPTENIKKKGGVYVAYTMGLKNGPGGYFGVQIKHNSGQFIFSIWDADRTFKENGIKKIKKSSKLAWPIDLDNCKRNCQDCGIASLREIGKQGFTTGTKCIKKHGSMRAGDRYTVKLVKIKQEVTINTADYEGFKPVHEEVLGEVNRDVTGSTWQVTVTVVEGSGKGSVIPIGTLLFESNEVGFHRLGTFDEMLGCNKCNAIYHKDTRYGPIVGSADGTTRTPVKMYGSTKYDASTCKKYHITGSASDESITFESGPLTQGVTKTKTQIW